MLIIAYGIVIVLVAFFGLIAFAYILGDPETDDYEFIDYDYDSDEI